MSLDLPSLLTLAEKTAHEAGQILLSRPDGYTHINFIDPSDIKLAADIASEALIRKALEPTGIPIIGEEEGGNKTLLKEDTPYWVVDPLDGTYNYARGLPFCCTSIGLMQGLKPLLGVIYDFNTRTTYKALATGPLLINDKPHTSQWLKDRSTGLILSSLRYDGMLKRLVPQEFEDLHAGFNKVRFFGTAAMSLAWVASGYAEGYIERCVALWDVAAGLSLLSAAGGHVKLHFPYSNPLKLDCFASSNAEWLSGMKIP